MLVIYRHHAAVLYDRRSVESLTVHLLWKADDSGNACDLACDIVERLLTVAVKIITQQQIFRRITAQCEFRCHHYVGALRACAHGKVDDAGSVAREISDGAVHLSNRDFHCANISSGYLVSSHSAQISEARAIGCRS